jgi:hypothetical protein
MPIVLFKPGASSADHYDPDYGVQDLDENSDVFLEELGDATFDFSKEIQELREIDFQLNPHPEDDVVSFNELYARVQAYQSRAAAILMDIHGERARWVRYRHRIKRVVRKMRTDILSGFSSEQLKALKNKEIIEAQVQQRMPEWYDLQEHIDNVIETLELLIETVVLKRDDLANANVNMSRQQKAVDTLVGLNYPVLSRKSN